MNTLTVEKMATDEVVYLLGSNGLSPGKIRDEFGLGGGSVVTTDQSRDPRYTAALARMRDIVYKSASEYVLDPDFGALARPELAASIIEIFAQEDGVPQLGQSQITGALITGGNGDSVVNRLEGDGILYASIGSFEVSKEGMHSRISGRSHIHFVDRETAERYIRNKYLVPRPQSS